MTRKRQQRQPATQPAQPRSLYRKIQVVLSETRKGNCTSLDELVGYVSNRGHLDFTRYQATADHSSTLVRCSRDSILKVIKLCVTLKLIDAQKCKLTTQGMKAAETHLFDDSLRKAVLRTLAEQGMPIEEIRRVARELMAQHDKDHLPTSDVLYAQLGAPNGNTGRDEFRTFLSLLSLSKGIEFARKKIYLP